MYDQALLQAYRGRLPRRASDAEAIDDDVYGSAGDSPTESAPNGLMDRLYQEQLSGQPMRTPDNPGSVPTTNGATVSPLEKYRLQRGLAGSGAAGGAGMPAEPMGPGTADPYTQGDSAAPLTNPDDGLDEFGQRRSAARPYMNMGTPSGGPY